MNGSRVLRRKQLLPGRTQADRTHPGGLYGTLCQANQALLRSTSEAELFRDVCRICVETGGFRLARLTVLKEGRFIIAAAAGPPSGGQEALDVTPDPGDPQGDDPIGRAFRGEPCVACQDWEAPSASLPVRTSEGVVAVLTLQADRPGLIQPDTIALLEKLASDLAFAVDRCREVRRRQEVDARLDEERSLYLDLVSTQPAGVYRLRISPAIPADGRDWEGVLRTQYQVDFVSDRFCEIAGLARATFQAEPAAFLDRVHPEDLEDFRERNAEALRRKIRFTWEGRLIDPHGPRWIRFESLPRDLPNGGTLWTGVLTDITEHHKTHSDYRRVHRLLRQVEAIAKVGGWEIDLEAGSLYWSEEVFQIHGLDPFIYTPTVESSIQFYAPAWRTVVSDALKQAIRTGDDFKFEAVVVTAQSRRIWVQINGRTVQKDGRVTRMVGAIQDISDRKRNEEAFRISEEKNLALIRAIPDLVFTNSLEGEYLDVHVSDPDLLYLAPASFLHRRIDEILPAPLASQYLAAYRKARDSNAVQELEYLLPIGGVDKWFEARVVPCTEATVISIVRDITERKRTEDALRDSELRHRTVFETSADGLVLLDPESSDILDANHAFCQMHGYALRELQGMTADRVIAEPGMARNLPRPATQRGLGQADIRWHRRKDGSVFPVELVAKDFTEAGRTVQVISVRDITERLKEEESLRTRVEQLQIMLELAALPDRHSGKDLLREGLERIVRIAGSKVGFLHLLLEDQETLELTAWTAETRNHCTASFDTHYPVAMAGIWADAVRLRTPVIHNDYPDRTDRRGMPEGHFPLLRELVVPVLESGKVRMIVGVGNKPADYDELDVGQLEVVAGDLWNAYARQMVVQQLLSSEASLRATFDQALVGIAHIGFDGKILRVNRRFGEILGYGADDLPGLDVSQITHPEDRLAPGISVHEVVRNMGGALIQEQRYLRPDGSPVWVQLLESIVSPSGDASGHILKIVEDITDRKRMETEIQAFNRDLERRVDLRTHQLELANQELEAFSYSVSHDLRAPLRAISGFSEALKLDGDSLLSPAAQAHLQRVQGGASRMAQLIEDLLHLSRIGRDDFLAIPLDLGALANQVLAGLQGSDPTRRVSCQVQHPLKVVGDPRLLRILLENLLGNAWKFTSRNPDAIIRVDSRPLDFGLVEISIRDNGVGFPPTQAGKLFTPFHRLHKLEEFPGTGIGLAIAKRIVGRHGGSIRAEGEVGRGATLHFTLPLAKPEQP